MSPDEDGKRILLVPNGREKLWSSASACVEYNSLNCEQRQSGWDFQELVLLVAQCLCHCIAQRIPLSLMLHDSKHGLLRQLELFIWGKGICGE